jgi:hypothetical protein
VITANAKTISTPGFVPGMTNITTSTSVPANHHNVVTALIPNGNIALGGGAQAVGIPVNQQLLVGSSPDTFFASHAPVATKSMPIAGASWPRIKWAQGARFLK